MIAQLKKARKLEKEIKAKTYLDDLYLFNKHVLNLEEGPGKLPMTQAHIEMCEFIDEEPEKYKLLLYPRGHMKSTITTVGHSLRRICKNPKVRILIANATYSNACTFLEQIKSHLKGNKTLIDYYGDFTKTASKWNENEIKIFGKDEEVNYDAKEPTVTATGIGSSSTSQHYDVIIMDDVVNRENVTNIEQIKKVYKFYKDCLDLLDPGGELIIIGTRWHDADLYGWIMEGDSEKQGEIPKKILREINQHQFIYKGPNFNIMKRKVVEGRDPIWPKKFTPSHIKKLREQKGPYEFSSQYNNEPLPDEDQTFIKDWFRYYLDDDLKRRNLFNFTMVDPAISQESGADYTVITTIAVDEYYNWFIREVIRKRMLPNEIIDEMFRVNEIWKPINMGLEIVAYQKMLAYAIREEMRRRKKYLPLIELKPHNKSKEARIKSLQPGYYNGKIFHKEHMENLEYLEDELLRFPRGTHDDIIDTLAYFTDFASPPKSDRSRARKNRYLY